MPKHSPGPSPRTIVAQDVLAEGARKNIAFTQEQADAIALATTSLLESADRLRANLLRNDEPAFGFRVLAQNVRNK